MKLGTIANFVVSLTVTALALAAGHFAYSYPEAIEHAANATIAALSIIFGLSIAVSSLAAPSPSTASKASSDPIVAKRIADKLASDNHRTLARQKLLTWTALLAVILGLVFLVAFKKAPSADITRAIAAVFTGTASVALLFTLHLPNLLTALAKRNLYFQERSASKDPQ